MTDQYDVIVLGAGPAGYVAAIRCAQLGMKTACVEKWLNKHDKPALGGTCLNVGCIPSKALLEATELYHEALHGFDDLGITCSDIKLDVPKMISRKDKIVSELTGGIEGLFKANGIDWLVGTGTVHADKKVTVTGHDGSSNNYSAKNIIVATGSVPIELPITPLHGDAVVDSSGALEWQSVPGKICVIGAGIIGARVTGSTMSGNKVMVNYQDKDGDHSMEVDKLIVAVGRKAYVHGVLTDEAGVELDERGLIHVNDSCETNVPGIYAIGDVVRGPMLAHKGSEEGVMVAEIIAGEVSSLNYDVMPNVIYTHPEVAWVGKTEEQLKSEGVDYQAGTFPFAASGRAKAKGDTGGLVKILRDKGTDRLLGAHVIGPSASELLGQSVLAMEFDATIEDIAHTIHAHPTLSEAMHEAALSADGRAIHIANRKPR